MNPLLDITVVGLGPGDPAHLTEAARELLARAPAVWVRTVHHPAVASIPPGAVVHSCDDLYATHDAFEEVYQAIADRLIAAARAGPVVYAVPGDPSVGETSVALLRRAAVQHGLSLGVLPGVSFIEPMLAALGWDALDGVQVADATRLATAHYPTIDPGQPALIGQVYSRLIASDLKITLLGQYPPEHPVTLVDGAGTARESVDTDSSPAFQLTTRPLAELDHADDFNDLTSLAVPALPYPGSLLQLAEAIAHLRAPDGCPWDLAQTHESLRPYLLEEAYETLSALDADDMPALAEELGDLLLQVVLHAQIAAEGGEFTLPDIIHGITAKIWRRHPHVFGTVQVSGVDEVLANWETLKRQERASRGDTDADDPYRGIPVTLPALARAQAVQQRGTRKGMADASETMKSAGDFNAGDAADTGDMEDMEEPEVQGAIQRARIGDALWELVQLAETWNVDAEAALREATDRQLERVRD